MTSEAKYGEGGMELAVAGARSHVRQADHSRCASRRRRSSRLAGCSGLARCDFFVEPGGEVLVNEINTMPGFTETSVYAKLFEAGLRRSLRRLLCDRLVGLAVERHARARGRTRFYSGDHAQLSSSGGG